MTEDIKDETGAVIGVWYLTMALSALSLLVLACTGRRKKEEA